MAELSFIPLSRIEMIKNYRDVEPVSASDPDVIELSQSFLKLGVLQPVLVRPKPGSEDDYQLIFGHRRYVACGVAGLEMIPCNIQTVPDEDILELQVTENLQRKDVHPIDEAIAFRSLIKDKGYTPEDCAAKFGKKLEFIAQRIKLNDLLAEFQKAFKKNILTAGQAFVIARLRKEDQALLRKEWKDEEFPTASISDVQEWIEGKLLRNLSKVPFKKDDATLYSAAGTCTACTKRSGSGNLLFNDLKEDDRCFDAGCFEKKVDAFFLVELKKVVETKPEVHIICSEPGKLPKEVKELLRQMVIPILDSTKFQRYGGYGKLKKQVRGFHLDGWERGKIETIYVEGAEKKAKKDSSGKAAKRTVTEIDAEIAGIKTRQARAAELSLEKIHKATLEQLEKKPELKKPGIKHQGQIDRGIMVYLLLEKAANYDAQKQIYAALKSLPKEPHARYDFSTDYVKSLGKISDDDLALMVRIMMTVHYGNKNLVQGIDESDGAMRLIAEYLGVDVKKIEGNQKAEDDKRIERANKRIDSLKKEKKTLIEVPAKKDKKALGATIKGLIDQPASSTKEPAAKKKAAPTKGKKKPDVVKPDFNFNNQEEDDE